MRHLISTLVVNHSGVMIRVAGLFSRRGYNIESIAVGRSEDPGLARIVIVVEVDDDRIVEQIEKQLYQGERHGAEPFGDYAGGRYFSG
jgi:acetolactate synthase-1/3 small subunit